MKKYLADIYGIRSIYHFTDIRNLQRIKESEGLLPYSQLLDHNAVITGGNNRFREKQLGLTKYIHLCFYPEHPMEWVIRHDPYRNPQIEKIVWLEIDTTVLDFEGVRYTFDMSNANHVQPISSKTAIETFKLDRIYQRRVNNFNQNNINILFENNNMRQIALKHEILVPQKINLDHIRNFTAVWMNYFG
jgi:hypothetical protein